MPWKITNLPSPAGLGWHRDLKRRSNEFALGFFILNVCHGSSISCLRDAHDVRLASTAIYRLPIGTRAICTFELFMFDAPFMSHNGSYIPTWTWACSAGWDTQQLELWGKWCCFYNNNKKIYDSTPQPCVAELELVFTFDAGLAISSSSPSSSLSCKKQAHRRPVRNQISAEKAQPPACAGVFWDEPCKQVLPQLEGAWFCQWPLLTAAWNTRENNRHCRSVRHKHIQWFSSPSAGRSKKHRLPFRLPVDPGTHLDLRPTI